MPRILITFLGTGNYTPCRYKLDSHISESETFSSVALASLVKPDAVISLETQAANERHGEALASRFKELGIQHKSETIKNGKSEEEIWEIFKTITHVVSSESELYFDITHGFRSLPILGFIALSYLRVTRNIQIGGIYYGAFEARDEQEDIAPVFNLTPFLTLLDWTAAADDFFESGSALRLGKLLSHTQQSLWKNADTTDASNLPIQLKPLGLGIEEASSNLLLLRTGDLKKSAEKLDNLLENAQAETSVFATPFLEILTPVKEQLTQFNSTDLATLRDLADWLAKRGQVAAALTLASEWLISYVMVKCGDLNHHTGHKNRSCYNSAIVKMENPESNIEDDAMNQSEVSIIIHQLQETIPEEQLKILKATSSTIRQARNDLNHAGFSEEPLSARKFLERTKSIVQNLQDLSLE